MPDSLWQTQASLPVLAKGQAMNQALLQELFNSMAPVFLLIGLGWLSVHSGRVDKGAKAVCSTLVTHYVFPALLFSETYRARPSALFDVHWIVAFTLAMCAMWLLGFAGQRLL